MFRRNREKKSVIVLGERKDTDQLKHLHGTFGRGFFTFYGGHDPREYPHAVPTPQPTGAYTNIPRVTGLS